VISKQNLPIFTDKFEILERINCFKGFYRLDKLRFRHQLFAGGVSDPLERELFVRQDAVCVLPFDVLQDKLLLVEQLERLINLILRGFLK